MRKHGTRVIILLILLWTAVCGLWAYDAYALWGKDESKLGKGSYEGLVKRNMELKAEIDAINKQREDSKDMYAALLESAKGMQYNKEKLLKEKELLNFDIEAKTRMISDLNKELESSRKKLGESEEALKAKDGATAKAKNEMVAKAKDAGAKEAAVSYNSEIEKLKKTARDFENKLKEVLADKQRLEEERALLKTSGAAKDAEIKNISGQLKAMSAGVTDQKAMAKSLSETEGALKSESEKRAAKEKEVKELQDGIKALEGKSTASEKDAAALKEKMDAVTKELESNRSALKDKEKELKESAAKIETAKKEIQNAVLDKETAAKEAAALKEKINSLTKKLQENIEAQPEDLSGMKKGVNSIDDKLKNRTVELVAREEDKRMQAVEMKVNGKLKSEIWTLRNSARVLADKVKKLEGDKDKVEGELNTQKGMVRKYAGDIKTKENEMAAADERLKSEVENLAQEADARKDRLKELKDEISARDNKLEKLQGERDKLDSEINTQTAEHKAQAEKLKPLEIKLLSEKTTSSAEKADIEKARGSVKALAAKLQELETSKNVIEKELNEEAAAKAKDEAAVSTLEDEDASKTDSSKDIRLNAENGKETLNAEIEKIKKEAKKAQDKEKELTAAAVKIANEIKLTGESKRQTDKDLMTKINDLKVRISAFLSQDGRDELLNERDLDAQTKKGMSEGRTVRTKLESMFSFLTEENDRLLAENGELEKSLKRAEEAAKDARRKAEAAMRIPEELKAKIEKERLDMHFNLGVVFDKNNMPRDAEREYLKCLEIDPKDSGVHYNLGILYDDKLNENNKALVHYTKFLEFHPMGDTAERVRDWITRIELEDRLGKEMR